MTARATSRLLILAGLMLLGWCALVVADGWIAQWMARQSLEPIAVARPPAAIGASRLAGARPIAVVQGSALATLSVPRVGLSAVVLQGSDARTLRHGPGHLETTALPGEAGNDVIAGHRDSFFRPLRNVAVGDDIFLEGPSGRVHYRVAWMRVVNAHDVSVLAPTDADVLTLVTCYPFWVLGNAPDRFVVRATRADASGASAEAAPPPLVSSPAGDDRTQIQNAVDRFRIAYNARIASGRDNARAVPLAFGPCDVSTGDEEASATCGRSWVFTLQRRGSGWAIRSVTAGD